MVAMSGSNIDNETNTTTTNENQDILNNVQTHPDYLGPPAQGLYDPQNEHEACGVGFIVAIDGKRSHKVSNI